MYSFFNNNLIKGYQKIKTTREISVHIYNFTVEPRISIRNEMQEKHKRSSSN